MKDFVKMKINVSDHMAWSPKNSASPIAYVYSIANLLDGGNFGFKF